MISSLRYSVLFLVLCFLGVSCPVDVIHADYTTVVIGDRTWTTNNNFDLIGSSAAVTGGELRTNIPNFLPTLRNDGPNANLTTITDIYG
ncbi:MAG: hypothetical protein P8R38_03175, partial [Planctomycetota bacterium]|nr:hypothetical protein [Planctomycetota bacterium]